MLGCLQPGDKILGFDLSHGGHLTHGSPVNFSGKLYEPHFYGVRRDTGYVDYEQLKAVALKEKPKMIICGASAYSRDWDYAFIRSVADEIGALVLADISHPAGLIARGLLTDPLPHCHIVTTTTHKTLRGPRGAMIMSTAEHASALDRAVFPGLQGGPHDHTTAAIAVALHEASQPAFRGYAHQIVANARALAAALTERGYDLVSGGTDNHLILVDLTPQGIGGKPAARALDRAGLEVNYNTVPYDPRKPFDPSGIRLGTPAITTRGLREEHMAPIAAWIDEAITAAGQHDDLALDRIAAAIRDFVAPFPIPGWTPGATP